jgi:hypothetical protein
MLLIAFDEVLLFLSRLESASFNTTMSLHKALYKSPKAFLEKPDERMAVYPRFRRYSSEFILKICSETPK